MAFLTDDERLAYWLNAYNAFTLHTIIQEYPISSVWKTYDGQFFQRRRHVAGGKPVSLDDIEHEVLRALSRAAHPLRDQLRLERLPAYAPGRLAGRWPARDPARGSEQFLSGEWNCRTEHQTRRVFISRIFKMYAEDFAGARGPTRDYRIGVLRFVARRTLVPLETIAEYELVYNVYDWGLNDSRREPPLGPILFDESAEHFAEGDHALRELHLYEGNFCNRNCSWCTINSSPRGCYHPILRAQDRMASVKRWEHAQAEAPAMVSTCGCPMLDCANGTIDACYVSCDPPKRAKCTRHASCDPTSGNTSGKNSCSC